MLKLDCCEIISIMGADGNLMQAKEEASAVAGF
jgi:hypothetical protein